jgi:Zn finger protein HypA/HybF involved in hydrogenase expression
MTEDDLYCDTCEQSVDREEATRTKTMADLDPEKWQSLCCPDCGNKLKTVFVGDE